MAEYLYYIGNRASPIRIKAAGQDIGATFEFVVPEVLVSQVVQRLFGKKTESIMNTSLAHFLSIPFIGGAQPYGDAHAELNAKMMDQIGSGMSGLPGLAIGYYLAGIFMGENIFRWPGVGVQEAMIIMLSKMLTRPVVASLDYLIGEDNVIRTTYDGLQARFDQQSRDSNFKIEWNK